MDPFPHPGQEEYFTDKRHTTPSIEQLMEWEEEGYCEATDGCPVEPDGICEHGCQSWLLVLGLI